MLYPVLIFGVRYDVIVDVVVEVKINVVILYLIYIYIYSKKISVNAVEVIETS